MKPKALLFATLLLCALSTQKIYAQQSIEEMMTRKHPDCRDVFLNAMELLPKLYKEKAFDSLRKAIDIWETTCNNNREVQYTRILLAIETASFDSTRADSSLISLLHSYAYSYRSAGSGYFYSNTNGYYTFSSTWAKLLLERKALPLTAQFICNVFAGNISNPEKEITTHKAIYPQLNALLEREQEIQRKSVSFEYTVMTGLWSPTGNAALLGVHPSFGVQLGGKFHRHQVDLTLMVRFLKSANTYVVKRDGMLYDRDYFFGGYAGADYNYYFVSRPKFEAGLAAGIGYDGFDIAGSNDDKDNDYLKPLSISSLNANTGLRANYFFSPAFYMGLQGRYNLMNYGTKGGSNLNGDAFSIDLIFGFTNNSTNTYKRYWY